MPACSAASRARSAASLDDRRRRPRRPPGHRVDALHAGQLHQLADQLGQPRALVLHAVGEPGDGGRVVGGVLHRLGQQGQRADRRLELVRDVGDEVAAHRLEAALLADVGQQQADAVPTRSSSTGQRHGVDGQRDRLAAEPPDGQVDGTGDRGPALAGPRRRARSGRRRSAGPRSSTPIARAAGLTRTADRPGRPRSRRDRAPRRPATPAVAARGFRVPGSRIRSVRVPPTKGAAEDNAHDEPEHGGEDRCGDARAHGTGDATGPGSCPGWRRLRSPRRPRPGRGTRPGRSGAACVASRS